MKLDFRVVCVLFERHQHLVCVRNNESKAFSKDAALRFSSSLIVVLYIVLWAPWTSFCPGKSLWLTKKFVTPQQDSRMLVACAKPTHNSNGRGEQRSLSSIV